MELRIVGRLAAALALAVSGAAFGVGPVAANATEPEISYAPVNAPGPALTVPAGDLRRALECTGELAGAKQAPVLLVSGTGVTPQEQYGWNYMRKFQEVGRPFCALTTPRFALEDLQISGEYVVHAIRWMHREAGRKITILGGSQGGSLPRWALRFWPDTRAMVSDVIGMSPTSRGTPSAVFLGPPGAWTPAVWQQMFGSQFMAALNSGQETFPGIDYTVTYSHDDLEVPFFLSPLDGAGGGRVVNVAVQDLCPVHVADHVKAVSYDAVVYALAVDALTHDGPAEPSRIDRSVCLQEFPPGVDPADGAGGYANVYAVALPRLATERGPDREPALRCYVTGTCARD